MVGAQGIVVESCIREREHMKKIVFGVAVMVAAAMFVVVFKNLDAKYHDSEVHSSQGNAGQEKGTEYRNQIKKYSLAH